ncbi:MAG: hypothetical protein Q7R40_12740 [Phaeospirillum sp.]|nr:hypothetical protein [Phaeospirillum sp.]
MQIDFHHAVTYVVARWAGFPHAAAATIAHAAQYVDDATNNGPVRFADGRLYYRTASAHRMLDMKNLSAQQNHLAWVPFHFLPSGEGVGIERLVCRPNSALARHMLECCIDDSYEDKSTRKPSAHALYRLGITAHVYADTWAHQNFVGIVDPINQVKRLRTANDELDPNPWDAVKQILSRLFRRELPALGHGQALTEPDLPWLNWTYVNGRGETIKRRNLDLFVDAADHLAQFFRRFRVADAKAEVAGLSPAQKSQLRALFDALRDQNGEQRHAAWLDAITKGRIHGIAPVPLGYIAKGPGSWKDAALAITEDAESSEARPTYSAAFLASEWKMFHDAAMDHLRMMTRHIFPQYGLVIP